jgi:hypothetical protein
VLRYGTTRSVPDGIDEVLRLLESSAIEDPYAVAYQA